MLNLVISVQLYSVVVGYRLKAVIGCRQNEAPRFSQVARWKLHHQALCVPTVSYPLSAPQRSRNAILPIPELSYITGIMRTPLISFCRPCVSSLALHFSFPGLSVGADSASKCFYRHAQPGRPKLPWAKPRPQMSWEITRSKSSCLRSRNQSQGQLVVSFAR